MKKPPFISLIGAGPGDPELITLKAVNQLKKADVVLYDALIHPQLLEFCKPNAELIFVGKRFGKCQMKQEEINELMVEKALSFGHVARLKGGDPFIFGRGHEELTFASQHDIPVEVIPGVSSIYAVPELQHIPLSRRGYNESFWVVTGTTKEHELSKDIDLVAKSNATAVILMGMHKLEAILEIFVKNNKQNTPVAIIQNGSLDNEKVGLGTVTTIMEVVKAKELSAPAVIIIGEVASLAK